LKGLHGNVTGTEKATAKSLPQEIAQFGGENVKYSECHDRDANDYVDVAAKDDCHYNRRRRQQQQQRNAGKYAQTHTHTHTQTNNHTHIQSYSESQLATFR